MALYTIGHSNHPIERFLVLLAKHEIAVVVDVRSRPGSRYNPQFNRGRLETALSGAGIEYLWRGRFLGGRGDVSVNAPEFARDMDEVLALAREQNVAIACSEGKPQSCHRATKLIAWVHRERPGTAAHHIVPGPKGGSETLDSVPFERNLAPARLWWELHPRGRYGSPVAPE